jgi:putative Ca2+/H+ antiporter (TMEM165/GDT1 family)
MRAPFGGDEGAQRPVSIADLLVVVVLGLGLATFALAVLWAVRWRGRWRIAALVPIAALTAWAVSVLINWPTEHSLWPFEMLLLGPVGLLYLVVVWFWRDSRQTGDGRKRT